MHASAFGCFVEPDKIQPLRDYANAQINPQIFNDTIFEVDYWFHTGEPLDKDMLFEFARYEGLYGNSIPQPKFAFDINFTQNNVRFMGKNESSIRITVDNISFIVFSNEELAQLLKEKPSAHAQIVGRPQLNEWMGNVSVQIMIDDIEITDIISSVAGGYNEDSTRAALNLI